MDAREMTPERLARLRDELRVRGELGHDDRDDLLTHFDTVTADRDEARQEVQALREQRDAFREQRRVEVAGLKARLEAAERALHKINRIRDSIIGHQRMHFSEHVYPLVAALDEAGFKGIGYDAARAEAKTLHERLKVAEARADAAEAKLTALVEAHDAWKRYGNPTSPFDLDKAIRRIRGELC